MRPLGWCAAVFAGGLAMTLFGYALIGAVGAQGVAMNRPVPSEAAFPEGRSGAGAVSVFDVLSVAALMLLTATVSGLGAAVAGRRAGVRPPAAAVAGLCGPAAAVAAVLALFFSGAGAPPIAAAHAVAGLLGSVGGAVAGARRR